MKAWLVVVLVAAGAAVAQAFGRFSFGVLLPAIRDDLNVSNTIAGSIAAANVGAYLVGTVLVAAATQRFTLLAVLRCGLSITVLGLALAANVKDPLLLAFALVLMGIGGAFVWIPAPIVAADALPATQRSLAVGLMSSGIGLGVVFSSLLSGEVRSSNGDAGWSLAYQVEAVIAMVVLVATLYLVRHVQDKPVGKATLGGYGVLREMPGWMPLTLSYAVFGFMYLLIIGFLTTRLEDDSGWNTQQAAFAFTLMGVAMIFGGPLFTTLAGRFGIRACLATAFALWSGLVFIVLTGSPVPTLAAVFGLGLLFGAIPSIITLYVVNNTQAVSFGPSYAAATLAFGVAQMVSPSVGGWLADLYGTFTWVFVLSATVSVAGLVAALCLPKARHPNAPVKPR